MKTTVKAHKRKGKMIRSHTRTSKGNKALNKRKKKILQMENGKAILMESRPSKEAMKIGRKFPISQEAVKRLKGRLEGNPGM